MLSFRLKLSDDSGSNLSIKERRNVDISENCTKSLNEVSALSVSSGVVGNKTGLLPKNHCFISVANVQ